MSLYFNNAAEQPLNIYYNGNPLETVYFNGNLVWQRDKEAENLTWWDNADWGDIHTAISNGEIDKIPLGATKTAYLKSEFLGATSVELMVVHKRENSIILHAKDCFPTPIAFEDMSDYSFARQGYYQSDIRKTYCENFYKVLPSEVKNNVADHARAVCDWRWQHYTSYGGWSQAAEEEDEIYNISGQTVFVPTIYELTGKKRIRGFYCRWQEYKYEGFDYQFDYYKNGGSLEKDNAGSGLQYWTCSPANEYYSTEIGGEEKDNDYNYLASGNKAHRTKTYGFAPAIIFE